MAPSRFFAPALFIANLGLIVGIWLTGGVSWLDEGAAGALIGFGALAGLLAYYLALWQLLLISRVGWLERVWGHDVLSHVHHMVGLGAITLIALHPALILFGYAKLSAVSAVNQFVLFFSSYQGMVLAIIAYAMFLGIIGITLTIIRKRLRYETWYFVHVWLYLAIIFAFDHQIDNGHDLSRGWVAAYWRVLFYGTLATVAYYRFLAPVVAFWRHGFVVQAVQRENASVTSVIIGGRHLDELRARAGQFVIVRFFARGAWWQAHPFSLSEAPSGTRLRLTIKAVGDFTATVPSIPVGTRVLLEGPLGRFTADRAKREDILMIAGGIGITPLRALFEQFMREHRTVDLIYAVRSDADLVFRQELETLAGAEGHLHFMPEDRFGRLTPELIARTVPDAAHRTVYLCGPPPMMQAVRKQLATLGVSRDLILFEKFQLG